MDFCFALEHISFIQQNQEKEPLTQPYCAEGYFEHSFFEHRIEFKSIANILLFLYIGHNF
jgi:hypothetical protein